MSKDNVSLMVSGLVSLGVPKDRALQIAAVSNLLRTIAQLEKRVRTLEDRG